MATAYLIVICDKTTNAILEVTIWSSPEWQQSRCLDHPTYVAYEVRGESYDKACKDLIRTISEPRHRYNWLAKLLLEQRERAANHSYYDT